MIKQSGYSPKGYDEFAVEKSAEHEWAHSSDIRAEFGTYATFLAYRKADAKGLVKILRQNVQQVRPGN